MRILRILPSCLSFLRYCLLRSFRLLCFRFCLLRFFNSLLGGFFLWGRIRICRFQRFYGNLHISYHRISAAVPALDFGVIIVLRVFWSKDHLNGRLIFCGRCLRSPGKGSFSCKTGSAKIKGTPSLRGIKGHLRSHRYLSLFFGLCLRFLDQGPCSQFSPGSIHICRLKAAA